MNLRQAYLLMIFQNMITAGFFTSHEEYYAEETLKSIHSDLCEKIEEINFWAKYHGFVPRNLPDLFNMQEKVCMYVPKRSFTLSTSASLPEQSYTVSLVKFGKSRCGDLTHLTPIASSSVEITTSHHIKSVLLQAYQVFKFVTENYSQLQDAGKEYLGFILKLLLVFNNFKRKNCLEAESIFYYYYLRLENLRHASGIDDEDFTAASRKFIDILSPECKILESDCKFGKWVEEGNALIWMPESVPAYKAENHNLALVSKFDFLPAEIIRDVDSFIPESMYLVKFEGSFKIIEAHFSRTRDQERDVVQVIKTDVNPKLSNAKLIAQIRILAKDLMDKDLSEYEWVSIFAWLHTLAANLQYASADEPALVECQRYISSSIYTFKSPLYISRMSNLSQRLAELIENKDKLDTNFLIHATQNILYSIFRYVILIYKCLLYLLYKIISSLL